MEPGTVIANGVLYLAFSGAVLRYLCWEFYNKPERLEREQSKRRDDATETVSATRFMPAVADVVNTVARRMKIEDARGRDAIELLVEVDVEQKLREVKAAALAEERVRGTLDAYKDSCAPIAVWAFVLWVAGTVLWAMAVFARHWFWGAAPYFFSAIAVVVVCLGHCLWCHRARQRAFFQELRG